MGNAAKRRADIQGLRAVAVLAVLLFHIGGWMGSGYIGVDVFFVISGYVISMAYMERFIGEPRVPTMLHFLQRRLLRLFPALIVMTVVTLVIADVMLPPTENKLLAIWAGIASIMQTSNLFFSHFGTNYWLENLSRNPFLHTWSLGVEWQFYAIFPLPFLAYGLARRFSLAPSPFALLATLAIVLVGSFWLFVISDATSAFFEPWSRFWQFALGILAYLGTRQGSRFPDLVSLPLLTCIVALALVPTSLLPQTAASTFASLLTATMLFAAPSNYCLTGRLLASPVFQAVGYASYSIYLTHWPIAVFGRLLLGEGIVCDMLLLSLSLASGFLLSWSVEYRLLNSANPGRAALACLTVVGLAIAGAAQRSSVTELPWYTAPPLVARVDGYHNFWWADIEGAKRNLRHSAKFKVGGLYRRQVPNTDVKESVAVWARNSRWIVGVGNSYIQSSGALLRRYALDLNVNLALYNVANCSFDNEARCVRGFDYVAESLKARKGQIELIYIAFKAMDNPERITAKLVPELLLRLKHAGLQVVVQGPSPAFRYDPHRCLSLLQRCPSTQSMKIDVAALEARERRLGIMFPSRPDVMIWSPYKDLCKDGACLVRESSSSLVMDTNHFSNAGEKYLYPHFRKFLASAPK